ncbi:MFS transporter [Bacillus testis]|uniref:MFS transporter n=1 Tax=Bacillus testis TaxID=1622072 RepID=UPI00067EEB29|nr:MFS transporter [Bacillus testis]
MIVRKIVGEAPLTKDLLLLIVIGGLYSISAALSNTFVNIYLWKQSQSFLEIGLYNFSIVILQPITFILAGKMTKSMDRVIVLRIGIILLSAFYLSVLLAGEQAGNYIIWLGALLGIGSGMYWLAYNVLTFEITEPENRDFFNGFLGIMGSLGGMAGPLLAAFIIMKAAGNWGYTIIFAISMFLFALSVVVSFFLQKRGAEGKYHFVKIVKERKTNRNWARITTAHFYQGLREGIFAFIVSIFLFVATGTEMSLGTFGLINSGIGLFTYYGVSRFVKKEFRLTAILIGGIGLFLSVFLLVFHVSYMSLLIYGAVLAFFYPLLLVPYLSLTYDVIGNSWKAAEMRIEYIVVREVFLNMGRVVSIALFLISISLFPIEKVLPYLIIVLGTGHGLIYFCVKGIRLPDKGKAALIEPLPSKRE